MNRHEVKPDMITKHRPIETKKSKVAKKETLSTVTTGSEEQRAAAAGSSRWVGPPRPAQGSSALLSAPNAPPRPQPPPLLPPAAELRMLKLSQLRVNRRTVDFDNARVEAGQLDATMLEQATDLADFQARVTAMAREIAAMLQSQNPSEID